MAPSTDEFPLLSANGLYAAKTRGNGNCLFNALSDQIYGNQDEHASIRARVIAHMRQRSAHYKQFVDVNDGGGLRRNPKRKTAGAYSSPAPVPTPEQIDRTFEAHLERMSKGGTYGDNLEITAFSEAYDVDVKIYQRDLAYVVSGGDQPRNDRAIVHIAYHVWQHYSSVRNIKGPHKGLPLLDHLHGEQGVMRQTAIGRSARSTPSISSGGSSVERELEDQEQEEMARNPAKRPDNRLKDPVSKKKAGAQATSGPTLNSVSALIEVKDESDVDQGFIGHIKAWRGASIDDDTASSWSVKSKRSSTGSCSSRSSISGPLPLAAAQTVPVPTQKSAPFRPPKRMTARERKSLKKAAQKAAAKERKKSKSVVAIHKPDDSQTLLPRVVEQPFRTLYI